LARVGRSPGDPEARADRDGLLAEARRMQFNEVASLIAGGVRA
jgi:hypothetical protein